MPEASTKTTKTKMDFEFLLMLSLLVVCKNIFFPRKNTSIDIINRSFTYKNNNYKPIIRKSQIRLFKEKIEGRTNEKKGRIHTIKD